MLYGKELEHEHVLAAQRENSWAIQEKNEAFLFDAYYSPRHVVLFFSVYNYNASQCTHDLSARI